MIKITVDGKELEAQRGDNLLDVCLKNDIYIPNLCYVKKSDSQAACCRLCFVEIEGEKRPVTSCTVKIEKEIAVRTDTENVRRLQLSAFDLIMSVHKVDCKNCPANKQCELQRIAKFLKTGLKSKKFGVTLKPCDIDDTNPFITYHPNRCVLCGKCIYACSQKTGNPVISFSGRGFDTVLTFYGASESILCKDCDRPCMDICPVKALTPKSID